MRQVRTDSSASDGTNTTVVESLCIAVDDGHAAQVLRAVLRPAAAERHHRPGHRQPPQRRVGARGEVPRVRSTATRTSGTRGVTYKWPIDAQKKTYQFYQPDLGAGVPGALPGDGDAQGADRLQVRVQHRHPAVTRCCGTLPGTYNDIRTVYVEPQTGAIIDGTEQQVQKLSDGRVALDTTLSFDKASIDYQANYAQGQDRPAEAGAGVGSADRRHPRRRSRWSAASCCCAAAAVADRATAGARTAATPPRPGRGPDRGRSRLRAGRRRRWPGQLADVDRGAGQDRAAQRRPLPPLLRVPGRPLAARRRRRAGTRRRRSRGPAGRACGGARRRSGAPSAPNST